MVGRRPMGAAVEMTSDRERVGLRSVFFAALLTSALCGSPRVWAQQTMPSSAETFSGAVRVLAHEKSAAEQYAVILSAVAKHDTAQYLRGFTLYADAKSEFDGLITELRLDLESGRDPADSAKFDEALKTAAERRVTFTSFVSDAVDKLQGARPGLPEVIEAVPELVKVIADAGLAIWKEFREAGQQRRDTILSELKRLEWQPFDELTKSK